METCHALAARGPQLDVVTWHIYADFPQQNSGAGTTSDSYFNKLDMHRLIQIGGVTIYEVQATASFLEKAVEPPVIGS